MWLCLHFTYPLQTLQLVNVLVLNSSTAGIISLAPRAELSHCSCVAASAAAAAAGPVLAQLHARQPPIIVTLYAGMHLQHTR